MARASATERGWALPRSCPRGTRARRGFAPGIALLAIALAGAAALGPALLHDAIRALALWATGVLGALLALSGSRHVDARLALAAALGLRIIGLCGEPVLSDDIFRYVHEGRASRLGLATPYVTPPARITPPPDDGTTARVNHPEVPAAYPPLTQLSLWGLVAAGDAIGRPQGPLRAALVGLDLVIALMLWRPRRSRQGRRRAAPAFGRYAFHPLPLLEVALGAHLDVAGGLLLLVATFHLRRPGGAGLWLGLASGIKPVAWLGALLARPRPAQLAPLLCGILVGASAPALPYAWQDVPLGDGLREYGLRWRAHPTGFALIEALAAPPLEARARAGRYAHLHLNHQPFGLWLEEGHETLVALGAARPAPRPWLLDGGLVARLGAGWVLGLWLLALWRRVRSPLRRLSGALAGFWLLAPTLHPWYLMWALPTAARLGSVGWWWGAATAPLLYQSAFTAAAEGQWHEALWPRMIWVAALLGGFGVSGARRLRRLRQLRRLRRASRAP